MVGVDVELDEPRVEGRERTKVFAGVGVGAVGDRKVCDSRHGRPEPSCGSELDRDVVDASINQEWGRLIVVPDVEATDRVDRTQVEGHGRISVDTTETGPRRQPHIGFYCRCVFAADVKTVAVHDKIIDTVECASNLARCGDIAGGNRNEFGISRLDGGKNDGKGSDLSCSFSSHGEGVVWVGEMLIHDKLRCWTAGSRPAA